MQLLPLTDLYMNRETLDTMQKAVVVLFKKTHKAGQRHVTHGLSMRDKDNFILCCSLQRFMGAIWYLLKEASFLMKFFFLDFLSSHWKQEIPVYGINIVPNFALFHSLLLLAECQRNILSDTSLFCPLLYMLQLCI